MRIHSTFNKKLKFVSVLFANWLIKCAIQSAGFTLRDYILRLPLTIQFSFSFFLPWIQTKGLFVKIHLSFSKSCTLLHFTLLLQLPVANGPKSFSTNKKKIRKEHESEAEKSREEMNKLFICLRPVTTNRPFLNAVQKLNVRVLLWAD